MLARLCRKARAERDWNLVVDCTLQQLKFAERFQNSSVLRTQRDLIDAFIDAGRLEQAEMWSRKLLFDKTDIFSRELWYQIKLVNAFVKVNRVDAACKYIGSLWDLKGADLSRLEKADAEMIQSLIASGKSAKAKREANLLFKQHDKWIPHMKSHYEAILLGKIGVKLNEIDNLPEVLSKGESIIVLDKDKFDLPAIADLWKAIGNNKRADEVTANYDLFLTESGLALGFKPRLPDPDQDRPSRDKTKVGLDFLAPPAVSNFAFQFAALASESLSLEDNARVCVESPKSADVFAGTYGKLKAAQSANHCGDLSFLTGSWSNLTEASDAVSKKIHTVPPFPTLPFKAAIDPDTGNSIGSVSGEDLDVGLGPGDYKSGAYGVSEIYINEPPGKVRLIVDQDGDPTLPAFRAFPHALINAKIPAGPAPKGAEFELWYNGTGVIKLDEDSTFNGIIYAPHARVEIGPGNATFCGAIVAKSILVTGNSRIYWDANLVNWKLDQPD